MIRQKLSRMKKSRRYLLYSLLGIYGFIFVFIGVNRATEGLNLYPDDRPANTPVEELAQLTDFDRIEARGDFSLEIVQQPVYSLDYAPLQEGRGSFEARVENGRLILVGFGNRNELGLGGVRVGLPVLVEASTSFSPDVTVRGFEQQTLRLNFDNNRRVSLEDNTLGNLDIRARFVGELSLDTTSADNETLRLSGQTTVTR